MIPYIEGHSRTTAQSALSEDWRRFGGSVDRRRHAAYQRVSPQTDETNIETLERTRR